MTALTDRQKTILKFIIEHVEEKGYAPTLRELMKEFGIRSPQGAAVHIIALERKGYVTHRGEKGSSYIVTRNLEGQRVVLRFVLVDED